MDLRVALLLGVFGIASYFDWRTREVRDELWLVGGLGGAALLFLGGPSDRPVDLVLEALLVLFVLQHFLPWDTRFPEGSWAVVVIEGALYALVVGTMVLAYLYAQPAPPVELFAVVAAVLIARALFETGLLYGGADAKALMASALLLPLAPPPFLLALPPALLNPFLLDIPFAFTMLVDGAVLTLVAPLVVLLYNLRRGEREIPRIFHMYKIRTEDLPRRFVWLKDPAPPPHPREETTAEDQEIRRVQASDLRARGVQEVWVTPQVPFLISLAGGALVGVLVGDVLLWLISTV